MKSTLTSDDPSGWYLTDCLDNEGFRARWWNGVGLRLWPGDDYTCQERYTNFRRLFTDDDVAALREELTALRDEVKRLKSQPYEMRRAERPDCVGLWLDSRERIFRVRDESQFSFFTSEPPYYYLGPIPVIVEQQPPKVVTINYQGKKMRAIPSDNPEYWTLLGDNGISCGVAIGKFEEVQS